MGWILSIKMTFKKSETFGLQLAWYSIQIKICDRIYELGHIGGTQP
jgi:hypothetical protein